MRKPPEEAVQDGNGAFHYRSGRWFPMWALLMVPYLLLFVVWVHVLNNKIHHGPDEFDEVPVVIYHSHTATEAYPSRTDISYASEPDAHYVLVSTRDPDEHELRSYRIVDGVVTEEPVKIVEQY